MSMIGHFRSLTADEASSVEQSPELLISWLEKWHEQADEDRGLDIDKAWHGIHSLLTGTVWDTDGARGQTILGGEPIGDDIGYGPARLMMADEVVRVADELSLILPESLRLNFDARRMTSLKIYPQIWDEGDEALEYLMTYYTPLRAFYTRAAARGDAILLYLM